MDTGQSASSGESGGGGLLALPRILMFDLLAPRDHHSDRVAGERVRQLRYSAPLLAAAHILCGGALLWAVLRAGAARNLYDLLMPLVTVLLLDLSFSFIVMRRSKFSRHPHLVVRTTAGYILLSGVFWTILVSTVVAEPALVESWLVRGAMVAGFAAGIAAFLATPSLLALNIFVALGATHLSGASDESLALVSATAMCILFYSIFSARDQVRSAQKRFAAEWHSQKAQRFVQEFEQGGRGWFWETDADGRLSYVSEQLAAELGHKAAQLIGQPFTELFSVRDSDPVEGIERTVGFYLSARFPFSEITVRANKGEDVWWSLSGSPIFDEFGRFLGFRGIGTDLTEQKRSEAEIQRLARFDTLTGLPNRTMMRGLLEDSLREGAARGRGCSLFLIDLDRFKVVNDGLGHSVGDALLKQVAQRLKSVMGKDGTIGRLGDDEFQAVLPGIADEARLAALADRLIQQASMPYMVDGTKIEVGASVGIAVAERGQTDADLLVRDADFALAAVKGTCRGTYCFFRPEMHSEARERQMLESDLKEALGRGEISLVYQPIVNSITEDVIGFEALARWNHPIRGSIPPTYFIPLAEECGLITQIGEWVLRTACQAAADWPVGIGVSVNLSPIQFASATLPATVMSALSAADLAPGRLELEITESVFLADSDATDEMFTRLKAVGVRLALDDFGTGYSSLSYLRKAPFDKIKIDQSFVRGAAAKGSRNAAIIKSIVSLAESLGMDTTAEGVEAYEELTLIRELGCSQVQGFIFSKPLTGDEARQYLSGNANAADTPTRYRPTRHRLIRTALLSWNDKSFPVRIRNISAGGVMLDGERGLAPGARVQLEMAGRGIVSGEVRWADNNRLGVRFDEELDLDNVTPVRPSKRAVRPAVDDEGEEPLRRVSEG